MSKTNEQRNLPISINSEEEYRYYLNELNQYYSEGKLPFILNESEKNRFTMLADLLEAFDSSTILFEIQYTNNTAEIKNFSNYDEAFRNSYSDHLWSITPVKKLVV